MKINLQPVKWLYNRRKKEIFILSSPCWRQPHAPNGHKKHLLRPIRPRRTREKTELNGSSYGATGRYSIRSVTRKTIATGCRRKIQIYELKNEKKRTIFDETIILTVEYDKINVIKIRRGIVYSF